MRIQSKNESPEKWTKRGAGEWTTDEEDAMDQEDEEVSAHQATEIDKLKRDLADAQAENQALRDDNASKDRQVAALEKELADKHEETARLHKASKTANDSEPALAVDPSTGTAVNALAEKLKDLLLNLLNGRYILALTTFSNLLDHVLKDMPEENKGLRLLQKADFYDLQISLKTMRDGFLQLNREKDLDLAELDAKLTVHLNEAAALKNSVQAMKEDREKVDRQLEAITQQMKALENKANNNRVKTTRLKSGKVEIKNLVCLKRAVDNVASMFEPLSNRDEKADPEVKKKRGRGLHKKPSHLGHGQTGGEKKPAGTTPNAVPLSSVIPAVPLSSVLPAMYGRTISLRAANGKFVSGNYGYTHVTADIDWTNVDSIRFAVEYVGSGKVALKSCGKYLSTENGLHCNRDAITEFEKFEWLSNSDGTISLRGHNGKFVSSENRHLMSCKWDVKGTWERFTVVYSEH